MGSVVAAPVLWSTGSIVVAHRFSCFTACGIFLDQGSNPYLLHWQADFLPLSHQGSPMSFLHFCWTDKTSMLTQFIKNFLKMTEHASETTGRFVFLFLFFGINYGFRSWCVTISYVIIVTGSFPGRASDKEPTSQSRRHKRLGFNPRVGKIPWRRARQPTPVFLPEESHG